MKQTVPLNFKVYSLSYVQHKCNDKDFRCLLFFVSSTEQSTSATSIQDEVNEGFSTLTIRESPIQKQIMPSQYFVKIFICVFSFNRFYKMFKIEADCLPRVSSFIAYRYFSSYQLQINKSSTHGCSSHPRNNNVTSLETEVDVSLK